MRLFVCSICRRWNNRPDKENHTWEDQSTFPKVAQTVFCICPACVTANPKSLDEIPCVRQSRGL